MTKAEQKAMDIKAFQLRVKCCWNCPHWKRHKADSICYCDLRHGFVKTAWDYWCEDYSGFAIEKNLLVASKKPPQKASKPKKGE